MPRKPRVWLSTDHPQVLTVAEVAKILRISESLVYAALHRGEIPGFRIGTRWLIRRDAVESVTRPLFGPGGRPRPLLDAPDRWRRVPPRELFTE